ncbi:MAG: hypothetical protein HZA93_16145 [Verrucomicrobia bacterium]|nr:hypothetical protein [Verrucomicrobiota bacterium]
MMTFLKYALPWPCVSACRHWGTRAAVLSGIWGFALNAQDLAPERIANMTVTFRGQNAFPDPLIFSENGFAYNPTNGGADAPFAQVRQFTWRKTGPNSGILTQTFTSTQVVRSLVFDFFSPTSGWSGSYRDGNAAGVFSIVPLSLTSVAPLRNASTRTILAPNGSATMGFVVTGATPRRILVRAIGPTLSQFGVANPAAAPVLTVICEGTEVATNSGWGGSSETAAVFAKVGAFALAATSRDSALVLTLPAGNYSAQIRTAAGGEVLFEAYYVD